MRNVVIKQRLMYDAALSHHEWIMIVLDDKKIAKSIVVPNKDGSAIKMHSFNSDVLLIGNLRSITPNQGRDNIAMSLFGNNC